MQAMLSEGKRRTAPYGPAKGMIEGLNLLRRTTPTKVDEEFLRANRVAPGNEYKVVGALRFLHLIDEDGRPAEKSRLLKTRGPAHQFNLQRIVREAYCDLFSRLDPTEATKDAVYNYFVTEHGMGSEMATKATRFFVELCRMAGIELAGHLPRVSSRKGRNAAARQRGIVRAVGEPTAMPSMQSDIVLSGRMAASDGFPLVLAITPETARMPEDELADLFRKITNALKLSNLRCG